MSLSLRLNLVAVLFFILVLSFVLHSTIKTSVHYIHDQQKTSLELATQVIKAKLELLETYPFIELRPEKLSKLFNVDQISDSKYLIVELFDPSGEILASNYRSQPETLASQSMFLHQLLAQLFEPVKPIELDLIVNNQFLASVVLRADREAELSDVWSDSVIELIPVFVVTLLISVAIIVFTSVVIKPLIDFMYSVNQNLNHKGEANLSQIRGLRGFSKRLKVIDDELKTSTSQVKHLNRRLLNLQEEERRHISAELHDELGQHLTAIRFESAAINSARNMIEVKQSAAAIDQIGREMKEVIRSMLIRLRPPELDELGLQGALQEMIADWKIRNPNIDLSFQCLAQLESLDIDTQHNIYRLIQEALTNITKHAGSGELVVNVFIIENSHGITFTVSDNGDGVDLSLSSKGHGIKGMRERVDSFAGDITFESAPGNGMSIRVFIPSLREA